jgi:NADH dehydrogenase
VYTARNLERAFRRDRVHRVEVTLVSRDNYFLMTPLLFEAGSGVLEPRHAVNPIRPLLKRARFVEGEVEHIDMARRVVVARHEPGDPLFELPFDHLVLGLGGVTNLSLIPGSEHALTFKTLGDAIYCRNHIIDDFERADIEPDERRRRALLRFVVVGAGLVGVELMGELTEFVRRLLRLYPRLRPDETSFYLIEAGPKILPEMERDLADHAARSLAKRGVVIRTDTPVRSMEPEVVHLAGESIEAATIVLATGVVPNPMLRELPLTKDRRGKIQVAATMRSVDRPDVWALGDCASIPDPRGNPYPPLAQHALRQARVLARNIARAIRGDAEPLEPFVYESLGTLAALGHFDGVGRVLKLKLRGFPAWWVWRTYYLFQMPRWERRLRVMLDWTIALLFKNDVVKLDLFGDEHPRRRRRGVTAAAGTSSGATSADASNATAATADATGIASTTSTPAGATANTAHPVG